MIQGPGNRKWEQLSSVSGGPQSDFSNMGQCKGTGPSSSQTHDGAKHCVRRLYLNIIMLETQFKSSCIWRF